MVGAALTAGCAFIFVSSVLTLQPGWRFATLSPCCTAPAVGGAFTFFLALTTPETARKRLKGFHVVPPERRQLFYVSTLLVPLRRLGRDVVFFIVVLIATQIGDDDENGSASGRIGDNTSTSVNIIVLDILSTGGGDAINASRYSKHQSYSDRQ